MTTYSWTTSATSGTAANYRAWGSSVAPALTSLNLIQTTDTGQVDWSTVAAPTSGTPFPGYEIFRFSDSLQAVAPIYIRLEYGGNTGTGLTDAVFRLTVGKGTNGAGTITGTIFTQQVGYVGGYSALPCYASSTTGGISIAMCVAAGNCGLSFTIERSCDSNGNPTSDAVAIMNGYCVPTLPNNWRVHRYIDPTITYVYGWCPVALPPIWSGSGFSASSGLSADGVTGPIQPIILACPGVQPWYSQHHAAVAPADTAATSLATISLYGSSKTFRTFGYFQAGGIPVRTSDPSGFNYYTAAAMRWE